MEGKSLVHGLATVELTTDDVLSCTVAESVHAHWDPPAIILYLYVARTLASGRCKSGLSAACRRMIR